MMIKGSVTTLFVTFAEVILTFQQPSIQRTNSGLISDFERNNKSSSQ